MFSLNHSQSSVVDVGEASSSILASTLHSPSSMYLRGRVRAETSATAVGQHQQSQHRGGANGTTGESCMSRDYSRGHGRDGTSSGYVHPHLKLATELVKVAQGVRVGYVGRLYRAVVRERAVPEDVNPAQAKRDVNRAQHQVASTNQHLISTMTRQSTSHGGVG